MGNVHFYLNTNLYCCLYKLIAILYTLYIGIQILLLLVHTAHGRENFHPVNSCTDITLADIPTEVYQECLKNDRTLHCLPDDDDVLGLVCFSITWIKAGTLLDSVYKKYRFLSCSSIEIRRDTFFT